MAPSEAEGKEDEWRTVNSTLFSTSESERTKKEYFCYVKYDNYAPHCICTININLIILMHDISYVFKF